jgi:hypothetical protein
MKKDTIYIDLEDDITAIVDKLGSSSSKIVALVPPKRSTVLNSAVNMKLLKSAAEDKNKQAVLVTSEPSLLSLAAGTGLYTTPNLHTKPAVPKAASAPDMPEDVIDGAELDMSAPVGKLAGLPAADKPADETGVDTPSEPAKTKGPRFKIPNFERFRSRLFLIAAGVILLIAGWWWAFFVAPKALVAIQAQTSPVDLEFAFNANTATEEDDFDKNLFGAELVEIKSTKTEQFDATGKKNVGEKATGSMSIRNCDTDDSVAIEAGRILTSPGGQKYETLEAATVPGGSFSGGGCSSPGEVTVNVRAMAPGADYNLAADLEYDIDGVGSLVYGIGGQMSGGTDKEVSVVAQKDVDGAKKRLSETDKTEALGELKDQAGENLVVVDETFAVRVGEANAQPSVGTEASSGAITAEVNTTVLAIPRETIKTAVDKILNARTEGGNQSVYDDGLGQLVFSVEERRSATNYDLRLSSEGHIGPALDTSALANDISGQRYSQALETIKSRPGVVDVQIDLSPFWVFSLPRSNNIQIELQVNQQGRT